MAHPGQEAMTVMESWSVTARTYILSHVALTLVQSLGQKQRRLQPQRHSARIQHPSPEAMPSIRGPTTPQTRPTVRDQGSKHLSLWGEFGIQTTIPNNIGSNWKKEIEFKEIDQNTFRKQDLLIAKKQPWGRAHCDLGNHRSGSWNHRHCHFGSETLWQFTGCSWDTEGSFWRLSCWGFGGWHSFLPKTGILTWYPSLWLEIMTQKHRVWVLLFQAANLLQSVLWEENEKPLWWKIASSWIASKNNL